MKLQFSLLIIALLMINTITGQIKIGDNPQTIHPASVLELESSSRVLVITRVTDAQMNTITPLRGALVYNTDQECLHYYDGAQWINICEAFDNAFTVSTDAVFNPFSRDSTVVITQTDTNYNFEVNQITGDNIVDTSINGAVEIQQGSITGQQISNATISFDKLADGTNTGDLLRWNGAQWVLENEGAIDITEKDSIVGNEILDARPGGSLERFGAGNEGDPFTLDVLDGGIGNDELATDAVTTDKILDGTIGTADIADNTITSEQIIDGEVDTQDIADQAITIIKMGVGSVGTNQIVDREVTRVKLEDGVNVGDLMRWDGANWILTNESALNITENDGDPGNELQDLNLDPSNILTLTNPATVGNQVDLSAYVNDDTNELSDLQLTVTTLELTNAEAGATGVDLDAIFATDAELTASADDDITSANFDTLTNELTVNEGTSFVTADLSDLDDSSGVTANATAIATNTANIATNTTDIATNTTDIATNTANIATNTADIATNTADIANNTADIATNTADIATNTANIATNTADIATNTADIATNTADIATNTADIATNTADIATNTADIATNTADIATNTTDIATNTTNLATHITNDNDLDDENELSDVQLTGTTLELTNAAAGATGANLASLDETVSAGTGITVNQVAEDFEVAIINPVIALGKVFNDGITFSLNENGISSVVRNSVGNYTVNLDTARPDAEYIIQLTLFGAGPDVTIEVTNQTTANFTVQISQLSSAGAGPLLNNPVDAEWYFTVTDF